MRVTPQNIVVSSVLVVVYSWHAPAPLQLAATAPARLTSTDTITVDVREATRLAFDVTTDGQHIVMDLFGQLWRLPAGGGDATPITNAVRDIAEDFDPAIAPDGRRIVFQSDRPGGRALWLLDRDGVPARKLTSRFMDYFAYAAPAWSPDGRRIAYTIGDTVLLLDVETGREWPLIIDSLPAATPRPGFTPRNSSPAWSPDGARIAFVNTAPGGVRGAGRIWEVSAQGGTARPISTMQGVAPVWSPDGARLAFMARDSANRWQIFTQAKGAEAVRLTSHEEVITHRVRWMPDGRSLVYAADGGLWRIAAAGGAPEKIPFRVRLTMPRGRVTLPPIAFPAPGDWRTAKGFTAFALSADGQRLAMLALDSIWVGTVGGPMKSLGSAAGAGDNALTWSPDGAEVAWTRRERPGRPYELVLTHTGTGASRVHVSLGADVALPRWSPDGKWIAFLSGGRLRLADARGERVTKTDQTRDLGPFSPFWGTMAWGRRSDALFVAAFDLNTRAQNAQWVSLAGGRRAVPGFPKAAANLGFTGDGHAIWVTDNRLWRATFDDSAGAGVPAPLGDEPAVEARHARDGSVLYLSARGLRLRAPNGKVRDVPWPLRYRVRTAPEPLLIRGARVIDGRGTPLSEPRDVLLQGGRIARIAPSGNLPNGNARVVEARGGYLLPGFIDLHSHIWDDLALVAGLYHGVTTIRDIASQGLRLPDLRNAIEAGVREGPRIVYGGAMFHGTDAGYTTVTDQTPSDSASIARAVAILAGLDAGFLKERGFYGWWRAAHLVREAHRRGIVVSGHCEHILPVIAAGIDGVEHILDCTRDRFTMRSDFAELARAAGLWIVPTAALRYSMLRAMNDSTLGAAPDIAPFIPTAYRALYAADSVNRRNAASYAASMQRLQRALSRYHASGVVLATGTDSPFPIGIQHEMEVFVESGLTPMQAIVAATGSAARVLNTPSIGTIAEGQWADLVLLSANPLEDIRNVRRIREVIQGGRIVDREGLRRRAQP